MKADFESILKPVNQASGEHSIKKDEHVACSYSYLITSRVPGVEFEPRLYVGPDAAEHFLSSLQNDLNNDIMPLIERDVDMIWDDDAERRFNEATDCYICNKPLNRDQNIIVRDHDHFHGHFRGPCTKRVIYNIKLTRNSTSYLSSFTTCVVMIHI